MKQQKIAGVLAAVAVCFALPAAAEGIGNKMEAYGTVGLTGVGGGIGYGINEKFTVRSDVSLMGFSKKFDEDDLSYKAKFKNHKINFYGDYFPAGNGFRLTAGLGLGKTELSATGHVRNSDKATFNLGDKNYEVKLDGNDTAEAKVKYPSVSPYFGIGWGHNVAQKASGSWHFNADLGVSVGSPKTSLSLNNSLNDKLVAVQADGAVGDDQKAAAQAEINNRVAAEEKKLKDRVGKYKVVPTLSVGVSYRF